jgi:two-component system, chemotaxis family, protein-glutamate methylesterase/glutaminase
MEKRNIVVIGASAGGFEALKRLIADLPSDFNAAVFIVWHIAPNAMGMLPLALNKLKTLPAAHAIDKEPIRTGRIYVAPPDHHLVLEDGHIRVTRGPKENRFRPAIDPLFRSAALAYGQRVIGIILSGALDDGTAGLWTIKHYGGTAIVQEPDEAEVASMPEHALRAVQVDYRKPVADMAPLLVQLCNEETLEKEGVMENNRSKTQTEVNIALLETQEIQQLLALGEPSPYTCPECHGVLLSLREGGRLRFRCHTGHAFSTDSLLTAITEKVEESLWSAIRNVEESILLLNHMGDHLAESNQPKLAARYFLKAREAADRMKLVRLAVGSHEQLSEETIFGEADN